MPPSLPQNLVDVISRLGGPNFSAADLEWAMDLPEGHQLVEWFASQFETDGDESAIYNIALEKDELDINLFCSKRRASQMQAAAQELAKTITTLKSSISKIDHDIDGRQERLAELSIKADSAMSLSERSAFQMLDATNFIDVAKLQSRLQVLSDLRSEIITLYRLSLEPEPELMSPASLQTEVSRLQSAFDALPSAETLIDAAKCDEVVKICEQLETLGKADDVEKILQKMVADDGKISEVMLRSNTLQRPDLKLEIEQAWKLDNARILENRERLLDQVSCEVFFLFTHSSVKSANTPLDVKTVDAWTNSLLPALTSLHMLLADSTFLVQETEALIYALHEEKLDIIAAVKASRQAVTGAGEKESEKKVAEVLEEELTNVLKSQQHLRSEDAPPLVLLNHSDLVDELKAQSQRVQSLERAEAAWLSKLPQALSLLSSSHTALLETLYLNSPMNTSPPLAPPAEFIALETEISKNVDVLKTDLKSLTKVVLRSL
ncbi:hypothetical protein EW146_g7165 [Bondarzewia mesenterica]|uniref:Uncharacterized protein n=1 Tax=Bondarzewia mesenterica TaxID=1095465 RepID=A0A4S4LND2_9AGAM|nr:hypothetical protein EW146_g7165 [Bondarzewia mesenterica]